MAERIGMINGANNRNMDYDFSSIGSSVIVEWVISGLEVTTNSVSAWRALVKVTRTNVTPNQEFLVHYEATSAVTIDTTGTKKVYIEVTQLNINDGSQNTNADGTWIGSIQTDSSYPSTNFIPLADIVSSVITDDRQFLSVDTTKIDLTDGTNNVNSNAASNHSIWTAGKTTFYGDWSSITGISADIHWITEITDLANLDEFIIYSQSAVGNRKINTKNVKDFITKFWGDGSDGDISSALTITWSDNSYIVKNYDDFAPWSNTVTITPINCILHLKIQWNCDLTNTTFDFTWKGESWWTWGAWGSNWVNGTAWTDGEDWLTNTNLHLPTKWIKGLWGTWAWTSGWSWWTINNIVLQTFFQSRRIIDLWLWAWAWWGWGWRWNLWGVWWTGGDGWGWGGVILLEVAWNLTFSSSTIDVNWIDWVNGSNGTIDGWGWGWGWWWGGWMFICYYNGTLTWTNTPDVTWGSGWSGWSGVSTTNEWGGWGWGWASSWGDGTVGSGNGWSGAWWAGWAWKDGLYIIEKNEVFT